MMVHNGFSNVYMSRTGEPENGSEKGRKEMPHAALKSMDSISPILMGSLPPSEFPFKNKRIISSAFAFKSCVSQSLLKQHLKGH